MGALEQYTVELRYKPIPSILDIRGKLASELQKDDLDKWEILPNRVGVFNDHKTSQVFVSYQNCGFMYEGGTSKDLGRFLDYLKRALAVLPQPLYVRWGVRLTSVVPLEVAFPDLKKKFEENLMNFEKLDLSSLSVETTDVGLSYVFISGEEKIQLRIGPMGEEQSKNFFRTEGKIPKVGVFFDIDYFREEFKDRALKSGEVANFVVRASSKIAEIQDKFLSSLR